MDRAPVSATSGPRYGKVNTDMIGRWLRLDPDDDGPFWALNLMKYRAIADYGDGTAVRSGREADDAYAPLGPLRAIGAEVVFHGDVTEQPVGQPAWDRIAVVRYPSRSAFLAMQRRDDFKEKHVHKEAGMEFTIVMSCIPVAHSSGTDRNGDVVLVAERGEPAPLPPGVSEFASFSVEGVIIGDDRTFDRAHFLRVPSVNGSSEVVECVSGCDEAQVMIVDAAIDRLVETIVGREKR